MAKKDKAEKANPKEEKAAEREFKFGVADLAEMLDIEPASVRVKLRNHGIAKAGKSYGWNSKADLKEVADSLKEEKSSKKDDKAAKGKKDDKAAKGGKKSKKDADED